MYRSVNHIQGYNIAGSNGSVGTCKDMLFRDDNWTVTFAVADLGTWLPGKKVLIPRPSMSPPDWDSKTIPVNLTTSQVEEGPTLDMEEPVSMEYQRKCEQHFHWPSLTAPGTAAAGIPAPPLPPTSVAADVEQDNDTNTLRSFKEIKGYQVRGEGGEVIGVISDMLIDDERWMVRYFVVDTGSWLPGKKVLVSPRWVQDFQWAVKEMRVNLTADTVRSAPAYDPADPINRVYEERLYDAFGKPIAI